jgi:hypothetical protein
VTVLGVIGFAVAMTLRDDETRIYTRILLAVVGGGFLTFAYLYASERGAYPSTLGQRLAIVLGVTGFAVALSSRDELSNIYMRSLFAGLAGGSIAVGVVYADRRPDRQ